MERKTISIYAFDLTPTVALTYNVNEFGFVTNFQTWVHEDKKTDYKILSLILKLQFEIEVKQLPYSELLERDIFQAYQVAFEHPTVYKNYDLTTDQFQTQSVSNAKVPHRNFVKVAKQDFDFIPNIKIEEKGENNNE